MTIERQLVFCCTPSWPLASCIPWLFCNDCVYCKPIFTCPYYEFTFVLVLINIYRVFELFFLGCTLYCSTIIVKFIFFSFPLYVNIYLYTPCLLLFAPRLHLFYPLILNFPYILPFSMTFSLNFTFPLYTTQFSPEMPLANIWPLALPLCWGGGGGLSFFFLLYFFWFFS